jgi:hypothetical protein
MSKVRHAGNRAVRFLVSPMTSFFIAFALLLVITAVDDFTDIMTDSRARAVRTAIFAVAYVLTNISVLTFVVPRLAWASHSFGKFSALFAVGNAMYWAPSLFGALCAGLLTQFGGFSGVGNNPDWNQFGYSWLFDSLTFNATQVAGFTTPIQPSTWWSDALVVLFSFVSDVVLFAALVNVVRALFRRSARQ